MRIAILSYHKIGGSGIVAYEIGRVMAEERGHEVHFVGLEPPFRLKENNSKNLNFHKVWVSDYPVFNYPPYALALVSQLAELIRDCGIDVIHSHYALPHAIAAIMAREVAKKNVRCITTLHGTDITIVGAHPAMKMITCYALEKSDVVTAVSDFLKKETERIFGVCSNEIRRVYNFVNPNTFHPEIKSRKKDESGKKVIMHISNLRPVKRPLDVIRIFHKIFTKTEIPLELWIIGDGPLKSEMVSLAEELSIRPYIKFLGVKHPVGPLIAQADIILISSLTESFGLAALEAMACKVPVVATRTGGLPEVIEDGISGMLFDVGDIDVAADKSLQLLTNKKLNSCIKKEGLHVVSKKFNYRAIVDEYETLYKA
ncbi:MAG: N-acetyl-alpha-D-glucosaminyl L-malate synthase BshA [Spirochaetales bacterium]|nr:N-acetyl-alpha-D-glucosaminyl L-malate synthase BshA [Spirochaetales bacterium]